MLKTLPDADTLRAIAREIPTPFHLYDEGALPRARAAFEKRFFLETRTIGEYFAVKANPTRI
jgi:diaminopimelate decarboxylase